jgi:O-antigen/teichoic acid export membrane protein/GT2 family glycosyltransferase
MSLTDKVIKNTYYHLISQAVAFFSPLILTPVIISRIGSVDFGIYVLVLGFIGSFGLLDISLSSSFVKFISEHYNKNEKNNVISVINTGFLFYIIFSLVIAAIAYFFSGTLLSFINIPPEKTELARTAFNFGLIIFVLGTSFGIFNSVLIGLQQMYLGAIASMFVTVFYFAAILILMLSGYGLLSLMTAQLISIIVSIIITIVLARKSLPYLKINPAYFSRKWLKSMGSFGLQMQVSKLSTFASDKYDEFLLGAFTNLTNVTVFNLGNKAAAYGKFIPSQLIAPVPPAAAELAAKGETEKLKQLYRESTKYINTIAIPIFFFLFTFAEQVFYAWMGSGYETSSVILRILSAGYLANFILSVPGNIIIPNTGKPRYQMFEGLIFLSVNLAASFILIKNYGITGAAIGSAVSSVIASSYIFVTSNKFFGTNPFRVISENIAKPVLVSLVCCIICYILWYFSASAIDITPRISSIISVIATGGIYSVLYFILLLNGSFFDKRDLGFFIKFIIKVPPFNIVASKERKKLEQIKLNKKSYRGELVSICIITHNRLSMLQKCITSLTPTLKDVNYELIIWDNNSSDGTKEYLRETEGLLKAKVIYAGENSGTTARGKMFEMAKGDFIIGMDEDVWDFPEEWIQKFISAYKSVPNAGFVSMDVVHDEHTTGGKFHEEAYINEKFRDDLTFQFGPAGGWCFMVSRKIYNKTGKLYFPKERIFFGDDGDYSIRVLNKGYRVGIIKDLKVYHATGEKHNLAYRETFENKNKDLNSITPFSHRLYLKFQKLLTFKRYKNRFIEELDRLILAE